MKIAGAENRTRQFHVDDFAIHLEPQPKLAVLLGGSLIEGREGHAEQADAFAGREELAEQSTTDSSDLARAPRRHCYRPAAGDLLEIGILHFDCHGPTVQVLRFAVSPDLGHEVVEFPERCVELEDVDRESVWVGCSPRASCACAARRGCIPCLHQGLKAVPSERRRWRDPAGRLVVELEAITAAAEVGLRDHDRWLAVRAGLVRKLAGRRSTSRLPALVDYVLSRPIVSAGMVAAELGVTARAAQDLVGASGLREATGRGRYRAWWIV
jgi:hypothetical protein